MIWDFERNLAEREQAVQYVLTHAELPTEGGTLQVQLPENLQHTSPHGTLFLYNNDGVTRVSFLNTGSFYSYFPRGKGHTREYGYWYDEHWLLESRTIRL